MQPRQAIFNVPGAVLAALGVMGAVHMLRSVLPSDDELLLTLALAFIPARYGDMEGTLPGGELAGVTSFATYMFVHGDLTHLLVNAMWMLAFGSAIAKRVGNLRFLLFSLLCGIAGALVHLVLHWGEAVPVVGASAAISGQMAGAVRFLFAGPKSFGASPEVLRTIPLAGIGATLSNPRMIVFLAVWAGVNLIFGLGYLQFGTGGASIAWEAHIGGFVAGLLGIGLFDRRPAATPDPH
ncbi:MAG: rhomboid family intramembrane serine protease [Pseudomonadota bacterium]|nr:rhomboid family intramembrane serine protease [Pseudomonadota bacterium]